MARRLPHPRKEIEQALQYAEARGWRVEVGGSPCLGPDLCPYNDDECRCGGFCITSVWSTPKNPGNHARALRRVVGNCSIRKRVREVGNSPEE